VPADAQWSGLYDRMHMHEPEERNGGLELRRRVRRKRGCLTFFTKAKRSEVMARIRSRGNKDTELALRRMFPRATGSRAGGGRSRCARRLRVLS